MLLQIEEPSAEEPVKIQAVGIDLGTTHCVVAVSEEGRARILFEDQNFLIPSLIGWNGSSWVVGKQAIDLKTSQPQYVLSSIKRLMGRGGEDPVSQAFPYPVTKQEHSGLVVQVGPKAWTPVEASAAILAHLFRLIDAHFGYPITQAVITVPAYFDEAARQATRDAAEVAGFKVLRLISEPTAAALAYGLDQQVDQKSGINTPMTGLWGVFDLGGGTFDFSLLHMEGGVFQVKATGGDLSLGGDDFDEIIARERWKEAWNTFSPAEKNTALSEARALKEQLTDANKVISLDQKWTLSRSDFEALLEPFIDRMLSCMQRVLKDGNTLIHELQGVVLVGGATRVPLIPYKIKELLGKEPLCTLNPDHVVALGAGLQAEALTYGAQHLLLDVTPLSLSIEVMGEQVERFIQRNTRIPVSITHTFTTHEDGQTALRLHVLQGESERVDACRSLAQFDLRQIPPLPAGKARIDVTFSLDTDGLLTVKAQEKTTGMHQEVQIRPSYGLTPEAMREMILEGLSE